MSFASALPGPMLILTLIYLVLIIMLLFRTTKIWRKNSTCCNVLAASLYVIVIILILFRLAGFIFMCIFSFSKFQIPTLDARETARVIINLSYVPDIIFWDGFALLFVHLLAVFYEGHMQVKISFEDPELIPKRVTLMHTLIGFIGIWDMSLVLVLLLYNLTVIQDDYLLLAISISNMSIPILLVIAEIGLQCKFSGLPYRSIFHFQRKRKLNIIIALWALTRTIHFFMDIFFLLYDEQSIMDAFEDDGNSEGVIVFICSILGEKIITEILPLFLLLDKEIIDILATTQTNNNDEANKNNTASLLGEENENSEISINNNDIISNETVVNPKKVSDPAFDREEVYSVDPKKISFENSSKELKKTKNNFGIIKIGFIQPGPEKYLIRVLQNIKLTRYLEEDLIKDYNIFKGMSPKLRVRVSRPIAYSYKDDCLFIIYSHNDAQTLSNFLLNATNLEFGGRVNLALEVARTMSLLYTEVKFGHGHLNPNNIMIYDNLVVKISDLLLQPLKKYYSFQQSYSNKTLYTAPEVFEEKGSIAANFNMKADIYSFGMILYEVFTNRTIFEGLAEAEAKKLIMEEGRPKLPETLPEDVKMLIRQCWQTEPEKRPTFSYVETALRVLKGK